MHNDKRTVYVHFVCALFDDNYYINYESNI